MKSIKNAILAIVLNGLVLYFLVLIVDEIQYTGGLKFFLLSGIIMGLLNFFVKPVIKIFSLPFVILTGGLFLIFINAIILWLLQYSLSVIQFRDVTLSFPNTGSYVIGAIVFGIINWGVHLIFKPKR
ncbi:hypothetical protein GF354_00970 [Candidatus Peregrinibacteria bacterium]|nr:hypothetical protein [Candidatus Peregrinibacteria bacterium]